MKTWSKSTDVGPESNVTEFKSLTKIMNKTGQRTMLWSTSKAHSDAISSKPTFLCLLIIQFAIHLYKFTQKIQFDFIKQFMIWSIITSPLLQSQINMSSEMTES